MTIPADTSPSAPLDPTQVATMLDTLAAADLTLAAELDRIAASRSPVSAATVTALERLLTTLRPAALVRDQLAAVDRATLAAAVGLRRCRRDDLQLVRQGDPR